MFREREQFQVNFSFISVTLAQKSNPAEPDVAYSGRALLDVLITGTFNITITI